MGGASGLAGRGRLGLVALGGAAITVTLGLWYPGTPGFSGPPGLLRVLAVPSQPYVLIPVLVLTAGWCVRERRFGDAGFAVLAPSVAVAANTWVLKPVFGRHIQDYLAYPSGHTVSLVSVLAVLVFLVPGRKPVVAGIGVLLVVSAGSGMIGLGYHNAVDIVGGAGFAVAAVCVTRLPPWPRPAPAR